MSQKIYIPESVRAVSDFYGDLLYDIDQFENIKDHLEAIAARMWEGVQQKHDGVLNEISNYHWKHLGKDKATLVEEDLDHEDCRQAIANEFGFRRWSEVLHLNRPYNGDFERAINLMLAGELKELDILLTANDKLLNSKSDYGHKATLLHYAVSNGVELWRQRVPLNLPEIVELLIQKGINTRAKMKVYNGEYAAAELLLSSAHPLEAGVLPELRKLFQV
ncbi:hypothetical protein [Poritiphilus flavus]|uniref:Ankyrin repeat domain-containing protein n=1 Tax=Poritiphilus flavus TaxID=2697053 RepID=A0A6L9ED75_9FLAO|nr:hypothetical protein [Poritiphilus flavus]NAS12714.1 hypothetical protein [Poritiphilus flavus]